VAEKETLTSTYGKFVAEPFQRGFGITVGNSLRRVLLGSLEGAAVTSVRFEGVQHEFATIAGVYEDVTDIVLNVKGLLVKLTGVDEARLRIDVRRKGPITAAAIDHDHTVEIVNPDLHIATLTEDGHFQCELHVRRGRGYCTADENQQGEQEIGLIPVASFFSPVRRVKYRTDFTRVGQLTNYDKLLLEIWTNGSITPELALVEAAKILRKHLNPFVQYFELGRSFPEARIAEEEAPEEVVEEISAPPLTAEMEEKRTQLLQPIAELDLSVRASNCLEAENIQLVHELTRRTEADLMKLRNFGRTTLKEIQKKLEQRGLDLGMDVESILGKDA
jgi:DNA-directed RNA polymerase subunit alpha